MDISNIRRLLIQMEIQKFLLFYAITYKEALRGFFRDISVKKVLFSFLFFNTSTYSF